jgi:haloalkane dehalogenase
MTRVLLTSVCQPLGEAYGDGPTVGYGLFEAQITHRQGIFGPRVLNVQNGLSFIAANLGVPCVVLHYPTERQLARELEKGYDVVGISFVLPVFHKLKRTVELVRKHSPRARLVLGGYGTVLGDEVLAPYCDHVCRTEGVAFMRNLLGLPPSPRPFNHPVLAQPFRIFTLPTTMSTTILGGLGCAGGCDFCCTSHYWGRKHVKLIDSGEELFQLACYYADHYHKPRLNIVDEDFLADQQRARGFLECVRRSGRHFSIFCFSSIRSLSQYTVQELAEMGIDGLWIGYEGKRPWFAKRAGRDPRELLAELRQHGIFVLASMILGLPYHTEEILLEELEDLLSMEPSFCQFLIYSPIPTTPFFERLQAEGRLLAPYSQSVEALAWHATGTSALMRHDHLTPERLLELREHCCLEEYRRLGPSLFRTFEVQLEGYRTMRDSPEPYWRQRAALKEGDVRRSLVGCPTGKLFAPSPQARERVASLERRILETFDSKLLPERAAGLVTPLLGLWATLCEKLRLGEHPFLRRVEFNGRADDPLIRLRA